MNKYELKINNKIYKMPVNTLQLHSTDSCWIIMCVFFDNSSMPDMLCYRPRTKYDGRLYFIFSVCLSVHGGRVGFTPHPPRPSSSAPRPLTRTRTGYPYPQPGPGQVPTCPASTPYLLTWTRKGYPHPTPAWPLPPPPDEDQERVPTCPAPTSWPGPGQDTPIPPMLHPPAPDMDQERVPLSHPFPTPAPPLTRTRTGYPPAPPLCPGRKRHRQGTVRVVRLLRFHAGRISCSLVSPVFIKRHKYCAC